MAEVGLERGPGLDSFDHGSVEAHPGIGQEPPAVEPAPAASAGPTRSEGAERNVVGLAERTGQALGAGDVMCRPPG